MSLYSPQADFSGDSAVSPGSPLSPVFTEPYQLPPNDDWITWEDEKQPIECFKTEPYKTKVSFAFQRAISKSPAVDPMQLANQSIVAEDVPFGSEGLNDNQPLFQNQFQLPEMTSPMPVIQTTCLSSSKTLPGSGSPPVSERSSPPYYNRKRKSSSSESFGSHSNRSSASPPPAIRRMTSNGPKKTAHNMIEKRYRTNLNDKISALRDSVPALRVMVNRLESGQNRAGSSEEADAEDILMEDLGGLAPAHKLNKATILSKATEYISHLERKNKNLARENAALRSRVEGFEMLIMSRGGTGGVWNR